MTTFLHVRWTHAFMDQPTELYSEVVDGWESRKVEVYADGRADLAGQGLQSGSTYLGEVMVSSLEEIAADPQFQPKYITGEAFEMLWRMAVEWHPRLQEPL